MIKYYMALNLPRLNILSVTSEARKGGQRMMLWVKREHAFLLCATLFALFTILSALVGGLVITTYAFAPQKADVSSVSGVITSALAFTRSSLIQLSVIFAAGFSVVAPLAAFSITAFRGVALGYFISCASQGRLVFARDAAISLPMLNIRPEVAVPVLYAISTLLLIFAGYISMCRAELCFSKEVPCVSSKRLLFIFAAVAGGVFVLDILRGVISCLCA